VTVVLPLQQTELMGTLNTKLTGLQVAEVCVLLKLHVALVNRHNAPVHLRTTSTDCPQAETVPDHWLVPEWNVSVTTLPLKQVQVPVPPEKVANRVMGVWSQHGWPPLVVGTPLEEEDGELKADDAAADRGLGELTTADLRLDGDAAALGELTTGDTGDTGEAGDSALGELTRELPGELSVGLGALTKDGGSLMDFDTEGLGDKESGTKLGGGGSGLGLKTGDNKDGLLSLDDGELMELLIERMDAGLLTTRGGGEDSSDKSDARDTGTREILDGLMLGENGMTLGGGGGTELDILLGLLEEMDGEDNDIDLDETDGEDKLTDTDVRLRDVRLGDFSDGLDRDNREEMDDGGEELGNGPGPTQQARPMA
jgi:hypothetical protein